MPINEPPPPNGARLDDEAREATEATPLLAASPVLPTQDPAVAEALISTDGNDGNGNGDGAPAKPAAGKPLPKVEIILLCYARFIEPLAFFSIFPYINQMLAENGELPSSSVGFYSGLIESLFSLTQMFVMIAWGKAADRFGRKPVLVFSLFGVAVATGCFGLARTIWQMILLRCSAGLFAGTIVTIRTMIGEHSTRETQATAFSWFAFAGNMGILVGPLIGGLLAEPAKQFGGVFGGVPFWEEYPYALPSFAVGAIGLTAVAATALFTTETLQKRSGRGNGPPEASLTTRDLLESPGVGPVLLIYSHVMFLALSYTAIVPVFYYTDVDEGGLGFDPQKIALFMVIAGFSQAFWLLVIFPPLQHRWGTNGVMRACGNAYPFFMALPPVLNVLLRQETGGATTAFWVLGPVVLVLGSGVSMSFTGVQLALNDVAPTPESLSALNALSLTVISALRSFLPAASTVLFAVGAESQVLGGYMIWLVLVVVAAAFTVATRFLPAASEKDYPETVQEEDDVPGANGSESRG